MPLFATLLSLLLSMGSSMSDVQQPKLLDEALGSALVKRASGPSHNAGRKALEAQIAKTFGAKYAISSSQYFVVSPDVLWVAASKNIQNQMLERSIGRAHYDGENPGVVLIDFYPQPHGAFVLAMDKGASGRNEKLVAYFVLRHKSST
jgi:hypothetical protein